jgi:hypothetical protein
MEGKGSKSRVREGESFKNGGAAQKLRKGCNMSLKMQEKTNLGSECLFAGRGFSLWFVSLESISPIRLIGRQDY